MYSMRSLLCSLPKLRRVAAKLWNSGKSDDGSAVAIAHSWSWCAEGLTAVGSAGMPVAVAMKERMSAGVVGANANREVKKESWSELQNALSDVCDSAVPARAAIERTLVLCMLLAGSRNSKVLRL